METRRVPRRTEPYDSIFLPEQLVFEKKKRVCNPMTMIWVYNDYQNVVKHEWCSNGIFWFLHLRSPCIQKGFGLKLLPLS